MIGTQAKPDISEDSLRMIVDRLNYDGSQAATISYINAG